MVGAIFDSGTGKSQKRAKRRVIPDGPTEVSALTSSSTSVSMLGWRFAWFRMGLVCGGGTHGESLARLAIRTACPDQEPRFYPDCYQEVAPSLPPIEVRAMSGLVDDSLQTDFFIKQLASAFSLLALVLAAIRLYGLVAYTVSRRTKDIGIRLALGAEQRNVLWLILRETLLLVLIGITIGVPLAVGGTRLVRSMLFGLGFADPVAILFAAALLTIVAALAGFLPAWRASRVDPMVALRYE
jgi:hypothetical protein